MNPPATPQTASAPPRPLGNADSPQLHSHTSRRLSITSAVLFALGAVASFHIALEGQWIAVMALFPVCLVPLVRLPSPRIAFYAGMAIGFAIYAPQLAFFWTIFGPAAVLLWGVLAVWPAIFLGSGQVLSRRLAPAWLIVALPVLWTGLEYFRSELYYLRFSWLSPAWAINPVRHHGILSALGTYGVGLLLFLSAALFWFGARFRWTALLPLALLWISGPTPRAQAVRPVEIAGAQVERIPEPRLPEILDRLIEQHSAAELILLPEYSLVGSPDADLRDWCRENRRHVVVGGAERYSTGKWRNTAWVVDPRGEIAFQQAKSVPIQFFDDGQPAASQATWQSPWGPLGIAVCYDLSYSRVMDRLVRQGATALIIPAMEPTLWGAREHHLHARVTPLRASEYGIPIARCASSGISQLVDPAGTVTASAPFDTEIRFFAGAIEPGAPGGVPLDRWLAPGCTVLSAFLVAASVLFQFRSRQSS